MPSSIIRDAKLWLAQYSLTGSMNAVAVDYSAETLDVTCLGDLSRARLGGLKDFKLSCEGFWDADPDGQLMGNIGLSDIPVTIGAVDGTENSLAYLFQAALGEYSFGGGIGEANPFSVSAEGDGAFVRGLIAVNGTKSVTGSGTAMNLGAVAAGQSVFASLHVLTVAGTGGPSITVKVQSDDAQGFATPTDQITFSAATAAGAQWASLVGPITDTWWRLNWTITGTGPSFAIVGAFGIK